MADLGFKRAIAAIGAALVLALPGAASAASVDCPPRVTPAIASRLPGPAPRLAMARTQPKAAPARKAHRPRPAAASGAAKAGARPKVARLAAARRHRPKSQALAAATPRRARRPAAGQPTSPARAAANLAQAQTASLLDSTACASPGATPDLAAPGLRLSMARSAAPVEEEVTPMPADFGAVDTAPTGTATPAGPGVPPTSPDTGGPTVILPPGVTDPTTTPPTEPPFTPPTGGPGTNPTGLFPPVAPPLVPGGNPTTTPGTPITSPALFRPPTNPGTGVPPTGPGTSNPGTGNPGAVPEPGAWCLLIVGFGLVGGVARSRRGRPSPRRCAEE